MENKTKKAPFDISGLTVDKYENEFTFHPIHPSRGEQIEATVTIVSANSKAAEKYKNKVFREQQNRNKNSKISYEEIINTDIELACSLVVRINDFADNGVILESNKENIRTLITKCDWLKEQIIEHASECANFFTD